MDGPLRPLTETASLARRGLELAKIGELFGGLMDHLRNPYDPDTNPNGFINMGTAENVRFSSFKNAFFRFHNAN